METAIKPSRISRVDSRYRHWAQDVSPQRQTEQEREAALDRKEEEAAADINEPLLIREQKGRAVMGRAHRNFHRQAAQSSNVLTVAVQVVATIDPSGNTIIQETVTPALPSVPAVPTVPLPSVPSVPAYPSELTVPAYPYPSGVPTGQTGGSSSQVAISSPLTSSALTSPVPTSSGVNSPIPTIISSSLSVNSTISNTISTTNSRTTSSSSLSSTTNSTSTSFTSSSSSSISSSSSTQSSSSSTHSSSTHSTSASSSAAASTSLFGGGGRGDPVNTAAAPTATNAATDGATDSDRGGPLGTPKVVGSVIGSLAGAAVLLALILFLIKRHKRKLRGGGLQLGRNDTADSQPIAASGQQMATRGSIVPAGAAAFFNRFSGASKSTADTNTTGERSFQRVSGRKLPSAFSEGMTSEQFARGEGGALSGSSFYKDDQGFYGGPGMAAGKEFGKETGEPSSSGAMGTKERIMPSPARTPVIHHPDDAPPWGTSRNGGGSTLSPPGSPNPDFPPRGTLGRSHPSHDGSRSSRFTENV